MKLGLGFDNLLKICLNHCFSGPTACENCVKIHAACDSVLFIYIDGVLVFESPPTYRYNDVITVAAAAEAEVLGIACYDEYGGYYGIVASADDDKASYGILTDQTWVCSSKFVDGWAAPGFNDTNNDFVFAGKGTMYKPKS